MFSAFRKDPTPRLTVDEVVNQVAEGKMLLLDVREVAEAMASGVAQGARLIPLSLLPLKCDPRRPGCELPQGLPVAIYCASGGRSGMAADALTRMGYGPVTNLGGLRDWVSGGGAVVSY